MRTGRFSCPMMGELTRIKKRNKKLTIKRRDFDMTIPHRGGLKKFKKYPPVIKREGRNLLKPD
jgi:hypothetical protein